MVDRLCSLDEMLIFTTMYSCEFFQCVMSVVIKFYEFKAVHDILFGVL